MNNIPEQYQNDPSAPFNQEDSYQFPKHEGFGPGKNGSQIDLTTYEPDDFTGADGSEER